MESLIIKGRKYISSRRVAELLGYTQDYVGQLARTGKISAEQVSGVWYVSENELSKLSKKNVKKKDFIDGLSSPNENDIANKTNLQRQSNISMSKNNITLDGVEYISSKRVAQILQYTQDYVGQLCRSGKMEARQIGRGWYIPQSVIYKIIEGNKQKEDKENVEDPQKDLQKEALSDIVVFKKKAETTVEVPPNGAETVAEASADVPPSGIEKPQEEIKQVVETQYKKEIEVADTKIADETSSTGREKQEKSGYYYPSFLNATYSFDDTPLVPMPKRSYKPVLHQIVKDDKERDTSSRHKVAIRRIQTQSIPIVQKQQTREVQRITKDILKLEKHELIQRSPMSLLKVASMAVAVLLFASIVTFIPSVSVFSTNTGALRAEVTASVSKTSLIETMVSILVGLFEEEIEYKAR